MAKISDLPEVAAPAGTETVLVLKDGQAKRAPLGPLVDAASRPILDEMTDLSILADRFANSADDADIPGGTPGDRGAKFWSLVSASWANAWRALFRVVKGGVGGFFAVDANGNIGWSITSSTIRHPDYDATKVAAQAAVAAAANIVTRKVKFGTGMVWGIDGNGYIGWGIGANGLVNPDIRNLQDAAATARRNTKPAADSRWDSIAALGAMMHMQILGQSNAGVFGTAPVSTTPLAYAKRFSTGVFPADGFGNGATLDDLYETGRESPASGMARMIAQLLRDEDGFDITSSAAWLFFSDEWSSSKKAEDLAPGTQYFDYLLGQGANAKALADGAGKTYASGGLAYQQGEANYSANSAGAAWQATVRAIRAAAEASFQTNSGMAARPLPMVMAQTSTHLNPLVGARTTPTIALAQLALAAEDYFTIFPTHFMDYQDDGLHFTSRSAMWTGVYWGLYFKRWLWDRAKPPAGLAFKSIARLGNKLLVTMDVGAFNLVLDAAPGVANYGVTLADGDGNAIAVSGVTQTGRATFEVAAASALSSGTKLRVGWIGNGFKGQAGIRDDQGKSIIFDPTGLALPMHNWAPISETVVL